MESGCVVAAVIENAVSGPQGEPGSSDVLEGDMMLSTDLDNNDALPQASNNNPPGEKQPHETSTAMVRSDITEHTAEPLLRSCVSTASMKVKNMKKLTFPRGHFPRLAECAHFHYETVDFGNVQLAITEGQSEGPKAGLDSKEVVFMVQITCQGRNWLVKRSYEDFRVLDKHLHLCIYDRRYSQLTELPRYDTLKDNDQCFSLQSVTKMLATYLSRFSAVADNKVNCGPVLTWMEVGFFPCDCVELINDKIPPSVQRAVPKPVPQVVKSCAEFIEKHGVVDGIYRLSGISSNIQKLRTLEFLMRHLSRLATFSSITNMHTKNLAIVWAPNLLRSRQIESACFSGTAAFMEVRIQSVVVEFILNNTEELFSTKLNAILRENNGNNTLSRPKSLLVCSPSTKLLSLEEAQARTQAQLGSPATTPCLTHSDYIEVGEGPGALLGKFHTVIELPVESVKRPPAKTKKSPVGNWLSFFHLSKSHSVSKRKLKRHPSEPNEIKSIALPGETQSYRRIRPRSTSEALSAISRDDLHTTRIKDKHRDPPLNQSFNGPDRVQTAAFISPPHQEDDLDLCPPAAGISSLDFDPMSFQCSPPSATPGHQHNRAGNKWRKSVGCSSESEPISSPNNNNISCSQSPDVSPILSRGGKKLTSKPVSPKLRKTSFKTEAGVQIASASLPTLPSSSLPVEKCEAPVADGKEPAASCPHCSPLSTASHASGMTDLSQSAQNLPDPGTDRLMKSVSVLPPHPPLTSAARKLALTLAESAHKASSGSQRRRNNVPMQHLQSQEAPHAQDRPARPSVLNLFPQEYSGPHASSVSQWQTSVHSPVEDLCCPRPVHFLPPHLCPESSQAIDRQESMSNYTPNVSPLGSGSLDEGSAERRDCREEKELGDLKEREPTYQSVGVSTPTQPVCSAQSPSTSPVYMNTDSINEFNFRAVLAETSVPASIEKVLPRPSQHSSARHYSSEENRPLGVVEDVYSNHRHRHHLYPFLPPHHRPIQAGHMPAHHCPRPDALPHHLLGQKSLYRQSSESRHSTLGLRHHLSPQYRHCHRDEQLISSCQRKQGQWQRSEDRVTGHPAIRRARSFHAPQISHYELATTEVLPPDTMFYVEQMTSQDVPYQSLIQTGIHPVRPQYENTRAEYDYNPYSDMNPVDDPRYYVEPCRQSGIRHSQSYTMQSTSGQSDYYNYSPRHCSPANRELYFASRGTVVYEARDAEVFERVIYQPIKQERRKNTCPVVSSYEGPVMPSDTRSRDIMHTRSKSDPGNACLLSTNRTESQNEVVTTSPTSQRSQYLDHVGSRQQQCAHQPGPSQRIQIKESSSQQPLLRKVPSLPERGCPSLKSIEHNDRSHTQCHVQDRLMMTSAVNSYSGIVKPSILRRPGRSQSTRENRHYYNYHAKSPLDPEHLGSFSTQPNRRTQSTKVRPTQYDHMEGYYAAPKLKPTRSSKAVTGYLPGQGCMSPRGHRLLSKVLGHEAFYHAPLRSEAGVYE
ncbi:Rho GTPase-activating protein 32 [Channa argus]|uniref:Rho GTPase-activating protein 32 n=1 Tax=Channa argus TaxID=215402 RepID=A0A6G1PQZ8_CHAAH|nr:Rho GTPase-activating protein 32 [Channa argus]